MMARYPCLAVGIPGHLLFRKGEIDLFGTVKVSAVALCRIMDAFQCFTCDEGFYQFEQDT